MRLEKQRLLPLKARGLVYEVAGKRLINGIDIEISDGPFTVMMGPNGAGKSVLLRLLHGLTSPTYGEVFWGGRPPDEAIRKRQAMVFQRPVLLRRSVAANVYFVLRLRNIGDRERCHELLRKVGLGQQADQDARHLSGGEQQRLALARALAMNPEVLFLDEPTASLDPTSTASIEAIVKAAHSDGTKIVFVTHDIGQAQRLADEVIFIHRGRVVEHTPARAFFEAPASGAARDYLTGQIVL
jgi:tungstate transport system ATP-binding protein